MLSIYEPPLSASKDSIQMSVCSEIRAELLLLGFHIYRGMYTFFSLGWPRGRGGVAIWRFLLWVGRLGAAANSWSLPEHHLSPWPRAEKYGDRGATASATQRTKRGKITRYLTAADMLAAVTSHLTESCDMSRMRTRVVGEGSMIYWVSYTFIGHQGPVVLSFSRWITLPRSTACPGEAPMSLRVETNLELRMTLFFSLLVKLHQRLH